MRKILLTLFGLAAASCGEAPSQTVKFHTSISDQGAAPQRAPLLGFDDPEERLNFDKIAVSGNFLYFNIPWSGMYRMPKYGGDVYPLEEANGVEDFRGVATNETDVYWTRQSAFGSAGPDFPRTRLRGRALGGGAIRTVAEGDIAIMDLSNRSTMFVAHRDAVYGGVEYPRQDVVDFTRFPIDGGTSTVLLRFDLAEFIANDESFDLVLDEDFAYITSCHGIHAPMPCVFTRLDLRTSALDTLATLSAAGPVAGIDATDLYFMAGNQLLKLAKQGGSDPVVVTTFEGTSPYLPLLVDPTALYLASNDILWSVPKEGGVPRVLATGFPRGIDEIAQDDQNVFVMYGYRNIDIVPKSSGLPTP